MKKVPHGLYYFFELVVLAIGFYIVYLLSYSFQLQLVALGAILVFYSTLGIVHHKAQHDLKRKIVIEYILISLLLFAIFVFLNANNI